MQLIETGERTVTLQLSTEDCRVLAVIAALCANDGSNDERLIEHAEKFATIFDTAGLASLIYTYTNETRLTVGNWRAGRIGGELVETLGVEPQPAD